MADENVARQREVFERAFDHAGGEALDFHHSVDPYVRYLRDRRLHIALRYLSQVTALPPSAITEWSALTVCAGIGGESTFLADQGFTDVTSSDFSQNALDRCRELDPRLKTRQLNAEAMDLPDDSVDLVLVQDGLHHLPHPVTGFTEMLRVARRAVVVLEPYRGLAGRVLGTTWERLYDEVNYVFRWDQALLEQATRSALLDGPHHVRALRVWDHGAAIDRVVRHVPAGQRLRAARSAYAILGALLPRAGNQMIGIVVKNDPAAIRRAGRGPRA